VKLLLSREGSTLQDILVDEAAKVGDAAVRQALRQALIETPSAMAARLGLTPQALKPPELLNELLAESAEDAQVLETARELGDLIGPQVRKQLDGSSRTAAAAAPDPFAPPRPPQAVADASRVVAGAVSALISDPTARDDAVSQLEGAAAISRRLGATLLRRAAGRASKATGLPAAAREVFVDAPAALAAAIEPDTLEPDALIRTDTSR